MSKNYDRNPLFTTKTVAAIATGILALGTIVAWYAYSNINSKNVINKTSDNPSQVIPNNETSVEIYTLDDDLNLIPTIVNLPKSDNEQEILNKAFNKLLTISENESSSTAIPETTKLIDLTVKEDGIHVNLSSEFTSGGGSTSMIARLGQVIYTASSLNYASPVWINVEGKPLEVLGGEGLIVEQPMTRQSFNDSFKNEP